MDFFKNLWKNQPNTVLGFGAFIILIGFFNALLIESRTPKVKNQIVSAPKTNQVEEKLEPEMTLQERIKYMKACAGQLRVSRVNWYLDEMGIKDNFERIKAIETTDLFDSSKPYELMQSYKAMGIQPKTGRDLPYFNCAPEAKDKLPKDFLQRFGY